MSELFELKSCPIFQVGTWNGDVYSEADLDSMVQAYQQVGFKPPLKLGHDESQPLSKSDSMPALGWVANLRRAGKVLYADFVNLPRRIYDLIRDKAYNRVSAEVYWDYEEQGRKLPRVLKAVALLGAEIPAVTSLQALESLYAAQGQRVKTYMEGLMPMPMPKEAGGGMAIAAPGKSKEGVNYREAGGGGYERCGACRFFTGPPDPEGEHAWVGACALVEGEIASSFVCDLVEVRDAFQTYEFDESKHPRKGKSDPEGGQFAPGGGGDGKSRGEDGDKIRARLESIKDTPEYHVPILEKGQRITLTSALASGSEGEVIGTWTQGLDKGYVVDTGRRTPEKLAARRVHDFLRNRKIRLLRNWSSREKIYAEAGLSVEKQGDEYCVMREGQKVKCFPDMAKAESHADSMMSEMARAGAVKEYTVEKRGDQWCLIAKSTGKTLGCHDTEEGAMAQERAVQANKNAGADQEPKEYCYPVETVEKFCPDCAKNMRFLNLKELKITYDPAAKTYAGFNKGLCEKFAGEHFRTACMESEMGAAADDPGAMCNALKEWCAKAGYAADQPAKTHGAGAQHGGSAMTEEEKVKLEGQLAKLTADFEAFKAKSGADLAAATKALTDANARVKDYEGQIATAESERVKAVEDSRRTENTAWVAKMSQAEALRLLPAEKPYVEHLLAELSRPGLQLKEYVRSYTKDGQTLTETLPALAAFRRLIEMREPNTFLFREVTMGQATDDAGQPGPPVSMAAAREVATHRAKQYQTEMKGKGVDVPFNKAYRHILDQDPELKELVAGVRPEGALKAAEGAALFSRMVGKRASQ